MANFGHAIAHVGILDWRHWFTYEVGVGHMTWMDAEKKGISLTDSGKAWLSGLDLASYALLRKGWHLSAPVTPAKKTLSPVEEESPSPKSKPIQSVKAERKESRSDSRVAREAEKWREVFSLSSCVWLLCLCITVWRVLEVFQGDPCWIALDH